MNKLHSILFLFIVYFGFSCNSDEKKQIHEENKNEVKHSVVKDFVSDKVFQIDPVALTKDSKTWYEYTYYNVRLSADFIGLDTDSNSINKSTFLNKLIKGNKVAFKTGISQGRPVYKLYELYSKDESIKSTIIQLAEIEMAHFKMEGSELPKYNFTDLNGKTYDNTSMKGKILVLKCWFIGCVACVKEFPELNKLVEENKSKKDVLSVSLAMDSKQDLINFLKTKDFKYAVIPGTKNFMIEKMHINMFPTHLLIDRGGKIVKVVNQIEELIPALNKEELKI